ncbi:hypothetical protein VTO73DRAFT_10058 [Trametes versicolor]
MPGASHVPASPAELTLNCFRSRNPSPVFEPQLIVPAGAIHYGNKGHTKDVDLFHALIASKFTGKGSGLVTVLDAKCHLNS